MPVDPEVGHVAQMPGADPDADFNENTNSLWSLYGKMAKEDDKDSLEDTTSGMDGLLIFVRSLFPLFLHCGLHRIYVPMHARLAYFPLSSPRSSSIVPRPYKQLPQDNRRFTRTKRSCCLTRSPSSLRLSVHQFPPIPIQPSQVSLPSRQRLK